MWQRGDLPDCQIRQLLAASQAQLLQLKTLTFIKIYYKIKFIIIVRSISMQPQQQPLAIISHPKSLLTRLRHQSKAAITSIPAIKLYRDNKNYAELNIFRQQLAVDSAAPLLYTSAKKKMLTYKLIFAGISAFFLFLAFILWNHSVPFATGMLSISESTLLKNLLGAICASLGGAALFIASSLRTDRDVANHLKRKAHHKIARHYARKKVELGVTGLLNFGKAYATSVALKNAYREAISHIHDHHDETLRLFDHISHSSGMTNRTREHLYNQALCELNHKLHRVIESFKNEI